LSTSIEPNLLASRRVTPSGEFVRWLLVACVFVIAETCLVEFAINDWRPLPVYLIIWAISSAGEAWIQFRGWGRRALWLSAGLATGLCVSILDRPSPRFGPYLFLIPAYMEVLAARGARQLPWTWLIATPAIYLHWSWWSDAGFDFITRSVNLVLTFFGITPVLTPEIPAVAALLGGIFFVRAAVGPFITTRIYPVLRPDR
jgi:hypothetical protein